MWIRKKLFPFSQLMCVIPSATEALRTWGDIWYFHLKAAILQIRFSFLVFFSQSDLGCAQVLFMITQPQHMKRRWTRHTNKEEKVSDSCLVGWETLLWGPPRGAHPGVISALHFKHKACAVSGLLPLPELCGGSLRTIPAVSTSWISPVCPLLPSLFTPSLRPIQNTFTAK